MQSVEYIKDNVISVSDDEKCHLCEFKFVAITKCCQLKLCSWHIRNDGEHADQGYYSCNMCETYEKVDDGKGFIVIYNTVYCEKHNTMTFCDECDDYTCDKHDTMTFCDECNDYSCDKHK